MDQPDLAERQAQLVADDGQQQVEGGRIPMRQRVAQRDQPDFAERVAGRTCGTAGSDQGVAPGVLSWEWWRLDSAAAAVDNRIVHRWIPFKSMLVSGFFYQWGRVFCLSRL